MRHHAREIALPVPLDEWIVAPSIDFVKFTNASDTLLHRLARAMKKTEPKLSSHVTVARDDMRTVLTIHDPTIAQLQRMIDLCPNLDVYEVEFTIDFRPTGVGPAGLDELAPVFRWFADSMYPVTSKATRLRYEDTANGKGRFSPAPPGPSDTLTTHLWRDGLERIKQRLYVKFEDQSEPVERPSVRLEAWFSMAACSSMSLGRVWQFAEFGADLRRTLSSAFYIADCIKPKIKRTRHKEGTRIAQKTIKANDREIARVEAGWANQGAMWAVRHGYAVNPDKQAHKRIGDALHRLGQHLTALKLPEKTRVDDRWIPAESLDFIGDRG
ncbi:hypothetical protein [Massilia aerilata]|uniref:Replication initiation protein n=1 Tax=Massilia aerilata TaxID=453817 RepID=A0ABW0S1Z8_9BURK